MIVRAYRALLALLLPPRFHDAFADDMVAVFGELARRRGEAIARRELTRSTPGWRRMCSIR